MPRESFAVCVARHAEVVDELALLLIQEKNGVERARIVKMIFNSTAEMDRMARLRMGATEYEIQRREAKELVELMTVVTPRVGQ